MVIVNEHRFLVSPGGGTPTYFAQAIEDYLKPLDNVVDGRERAYYVGGINDVYELDHSATDFALKVARRIRSRSFFVNVQLHKLLNMR